MDYKIKKLFRFLRGSFTLPEPAGPITNTAAPDDISLCWGIGVDHPLVKLTNSFIEGLDCLIIIVI